MDPRAQKACRPTVVASGRNWGSKTYSFCAQNWPKAARTCCRFVKKVRSDQGMATRWYTADWLLLEGELREGWGLEVSEDGRISSAQPEPPRSATRFRNCVVLPGLVNPHSHAFQRLL